MQLESPIELVRGTTCCRCLALTGKTQETQTVEQRSFKISKGIFACHFDEILKVTLTQGMSLFARANNLVPLVASRNNWR